MPLFLSHALAYGSEPTVLEFSILNAQSVFEDTVGKHYHANDLEARLGLGWHPSQYVTIHAAVGGSWLWAFDGGFHSAYHNTHQEHGHLGAFTLAASLEIHPPSRIISLYGEWSASSFFATHRAGIFRMFCGTGITFTPFHHTDHTLRTAQFGIGVRFMPLDDFGKVFDLSHAPCEMQLRVLWGF